MKQTLLDCCISITDGDHLPPPKSENGVPFITISNFTPFNTVSFENTMFVSRKYYDSLPDCKKPRQGDILYSMVGSFGIPVYIEDDRPFVFQRHIAILRPKQAICGKYLYYLLLNPQFYKLMDKLAIGCAQRTITLDTLRNLIVEFPNLHTQEKIAEVLSTIDKKINSNIQIRSELEAMAKTLYDYWFVQFDFPDENGNPYRTSGGEMVWNEQLNREIPKGWVAKSINSMVTSQRGITYDKHDLVQNPNDGVLILRGNNIQNHKLIYDNNTAYIPADFISDGQRIKAHDILITMSSGSKEHIGKCVMAYYDLPHTYGAFLSKLTPDKDKRYFVYISMLSDFFKKKIKAICSGTGINNLTNDTFNNVLLPVPSQKIMRKFENIVASLFEKIGCCEAENEELTKLRDWLLPMLMNGQATVE